jgi:hypothetical protein
VVCSKTNLVVSFLYLYFAGSSGDFQNLVKVDFFHVELLKNLVMIASRGGVPCSHLQV